MSEEKTPAFNEETSSEDSKPDAIAIFSLIVISVVAAVLWVSNQ